MISARHEVARSRNAWSSGSTCSGPLDAGAELGGSLVDPVWMRHGVATLLVQDAVAITRRSGRGWIDVTANPHAAACYASAGFGWVADTQTQYGPAPRLRLTT